MPWKIHIALPSPFLYAFLTWKVMHVSVENKPCFAKLLSVCNSHMKSNACVSLWKIHIALPSSFLYAFLAWKVMRATLDLLYVSSCRGVTNETVNLNLKSSHIGDVNFLVWSTLLAKKFATFKPWWTHSNIMLYIYSDLSYATLQ
jgi:hypothetical protein